MINKQVKNKNYKKRNLIYENLKYIKYKQIMKQDKKTANTNWEIN